MKHHLKSHLPIKSHYFLAPTASGDLTPPPSQRPMFFPCRVDSLTMHTFLLPVKPGWRLNVWEAAMRQWGGGERRRRFRSAWGKGSLLLKEPFVTIISPGLSCVQALWKVTLIPARRAGKPAFLAGSHRNDFIKRKKWWNCLKSGLFLKLDEE